MIKSGKSVKVFLKGESPWAVIEEIIDETHMRARIDNNLVNTEEHGLSYGDIAPFVLREIVENRHTWEHDMEAQIDMPDTAAETNPRVRLAEFKKDLESIINKHSMENFWDMPDFIMADMITSFIEAAGHTMKNNLNWHGCDSICHPKTPDGGQVQQTISPMDDIQYFLSFVPDWAKEVPEDLDPIFYGTGSYEGDLKVKDMVDKIIARTT